MTGTELVNPDAPRAWPAQEGTVRVMVSMDPIHHEVVYRHQNARINTLFSAVDGKSPRQLADEVAILTACIEAEIAEAKIVEADRDRLADMVEQLTRERDAWQEEVTIARDCLSAKDEYIGALRSERDQFLNDRWFGDDLLAASRGLQSEVDAGRAPSNEQFESLRKALEHFTEVQT